MTVNKSIEPGHCGSIQWEVFLEINCSYIFKILRELTYEDSKILKKHLDGCFLHLNMTVSSIFGYSCYGKCLLCKCDYQKRIQEACHIQLTLTTVNGFQMLSIVRKSSILDVIGILRRSIIYRSMICAAIIC